MREDKWRQGECLAPHVSLRFHSSTRDIALSRVLALVGAITPPQARNHLVNLRVAFYQSNCLTRALVALLNCDSTVHEWKR